ncbi:hypothetical protein PPL_11070 [Heterostelium album PN500]|uniref:ADP-ribosylation factor n=1 Tax=Heterostelium pallidum (strain ATCC 26659 / Pp 5 / PN500) TaxID=670386 RepID=D3BSV0_HETP5|nr:hypothetical protein PPL_11070 [Heterostelium album PN500]EFA75565.1 hypothetical protein PPL_11070 [Heterostelium album PN500]|eukprot:XP_020427699.1 hypothetical protein PPL_11070 [Heterostelium album PN500]
MGLLYTKIVELYQPKHNILMLGLDGAGKYLLILFYFKTKTTIVFNIEILGEVNILFTTCVETVEYKNLSFTSWDIGGQKKVCDLWRHYFYNTSAVVFVLDATDHERINDVQEAISSLISEESLMGVSLLILLNKQDKPNAMNPEQLIETLNLNDIKDRKWYVQPTTAITGADY